MIHAVADRMDGYLPLKGQRQCLSPGIIEREREEFISCIVLMQVRNALRKREGSERKCDVLFPPFLDGNTDDVTNHAERQNLRCLLNWLVFGWPRRRPRGWWRRATGLS